MPANANPLRIVNLPAAVAVAQFVAVDSTGAIASAGQRAIGFTTAAAKAGGAAPVCVMGSAAAWAGAAISLGQALEVGANGSVVPLSGGTQIGTALNAAASGDQVEVLIGAAAPVLGAVKATLSVVGDSFFFLGRFANASETTAYGASPLDMALGLARQPFLSTTMHAVGGSGVTAAFAGTSFDTQVAAAIATTNTDVLLMGGTNDVLNVITVDTPTQSAACITALKAAWLRHIQTLISAGRRIWVWTCPTQNAAYGSYMVARNAALMEVNRWLMARCDGAITSTLLNVVDVAGGVRNPASATGDWKANCVLADGLHPNNVGSYWIGKAGAAGWSALPSTLQMVTSAADSYSYQNTSRQLNDNPLMTAGATDATGYTQAAIAGGGCVRTLVARADGYGNDQVLTITAAAAADGWSFKGTNAASRAVAGDLVWAEAEINVPAANKIRSLMVDLLQNGGGGFIRSRVLTPASTVANDLEYPEAFTYYARTTPMVLAAGQTVLQAEFRPLYSAAGSSAPRCGRMAVWRQPAA